MTISLESLKQLDSRWQPARWQDYEKFREDPSFNHGQLFFFNNQLLVENMPGEGLPHARTSDLIRLILGCYCLQYLEGQAEMVSQCSLEKQGKLAAVPDIGLYVGDRIPRYQSGDFRAINLAEERPPDLVMEIADTTLSSDLDRKKHLYEAMGIPEYWVIDVKGSRVFAFTLSEEETYVEIETSLILAGLSMTLINQALEKISTSNITAAAWFMETIKTIKESS
jgi:Uma2 family endonuclease